MSSDFKLDIYQHDPEEPESGSAILSEKLLDERANAIHTVPKQGNMSINNFATNAERRAWNHRCEINLYAFLHFPLFALFLLCHGKFRSQDFMFVLIVYNSFHSIVP